MATQILASGPVHAPRDGISGGEGGGVGGRPRSIAIQGLMATAAGALALAGKTADQNP